MGLPIWENRTPGVLCVRDVHAIPVSTAVRADERRLLFALGPRRETLARLRADPHVSFCLLGRDVAFTAFGTARVVGELVGGVVAVELAVDRVQDHLADGRTEMLSGPTYRWRDSDAAAAEPRIIAELMALAG